MPETVPPPTTMFPFTSIFPVSEALDPTERIVPDRDPELATAILQLTMLLLVIETVPPE